jgi:hypothetical protein
LQELEVDLKLHLDLKKNQDLEAADKDINDCLVVLGAAAGRLAPDAQTRVTLRKQEVAVRDLAIRAEVHPDPDIRKTADYFQQKSTELRALNRSVEEIRTRLVTLVDRLEKFTTQLKFNHTAAQIGEAVKDGVVSLENIQAIGEDAQRNSCGPRSPLARRAMSWNSSSRATPDGRCVSWMDIGKSAAVRRPSIAHRNRWRRCRLPSPTRPSAPNPSSSYGLLAKSTP